MDIKKNWIFYTYNEKIIKTLLNIVDFWNIDMKFLEPAVGKWNILLKAIEIFIEKNNNIENKILAEKILNNFYGFDIDNKGLQQTIIEINNFVKKTLKINNFDISSNIIFNNVFLKNDLARFENFFDYVISNPPYITYYGKQNKWLSHEQRIYFINNYKFVSNKKIFNKFNSIMFFLEKSLNYLKNNWKCSYIVDISILENPYKYIKKYLFTKSKIINYIENIKSFEWVNSWQIIISYQKSKHKNYFYDYYKSIDNFFLWKSEKINSQNLYQINNFFVPKSYEDNNIIKIIEKKCSQTLWDIFPWKQIRTCTVLPDANEYFLTTEWNINRNIFLFPYLEWKKSLQNKFWELKYEKYLKYDYQMALEISNKFKIELKNKWVINPKRIWLWPKDAYQKWVPKIFIRQSWTQITCTYTKEKFASNNSLYIIYWNFKDYDENIFYYITGYLNSEIITKYCLAKNIIRNQTWKFPQIKMSDLKKIPIYIDQTNFEKIYNLSKILTKQNWNNDILYKKINDFISNIFYQF